MTFLAAMAQEFGPKSKAAIQGQTLQEFSQELKKLSDLDRAWYCSELNKAGVPCELAPTPPKA